MTRPKIRDEAALAEETAVRTLARTLAERIPNTADRIQALRAAGRDAFVQRVTKEGWLPDILRRGGPLARQLAKEHHPDYTTQKHLKVIA